MLPNTVGNTTLVNMVTANVTKPNPAVIARRSSPMAFSPNGLNTKRKRKMKSEMPKAANILPDGLLEYGNGWVRKRNIEKGNNNAAK